jgi:disulfide oxidoreductase YuzD
MNENDSVIVRVFGAPTAGACCSSNGWQEATEWVGGSIRQRFGDRVRVEYIDIFTPEMDTFPDILQSIAREGARLPFVYVGDHLLSAGERISGPAIRRFLEKQGIKAVS